MAEAQGCTVFELRNVNFKRQLLAMPTVKLCESCTKHVDHGLASGRDGGRNDRFWSCGTVEEECTCEGDDSDCRLCKGTGYIAEKCLTCDGEGYVEVTP